MVLARLKHYFLTYKDLPGNKRDCEITHTYGIDEAHEVINRSIRDYQIRFESLNNALANV
jgi:inorganic pyrophosphatase